MYESFEEYKKYLDANKEKFPENIFIFASDINRHQLNSPHSLHDSWLTSISIKENREIERPFNPKPTIRIELLGQMHDRDIVLLYEGVEYYCMEGIKNLSNWGDTFHGDITSHQVTINARGHVVHEIFFASGATVLIECKGVECEEKLYTE